jgi:hypothetical protein
LPITDQEKEKPLEEIEWFLRAKSEEEIREEGRGIR